MQVILQVICLENSKIETFSEHGETFSFWVIVIILHAVIYENFVVKSNVHKKYCVYNGQ